MKIKIARAYPVINKTIGWPEMVTDAVMTVLLCGAFLTFGKTIIVAASVLEATWLP